MSEQRSFSHTSMSTYRRCKAQYKWKYIDNLLPTEGTGRIRGSAGHAALATWYSNGCDEEADKLAIEAMSNKFNDAESESGLDLHSEWDLMCIIIPRYFEWARKNDNFDEIIAIEQKFEMGIGEHTVIGFIDGVVRSKNGSIWLLEHKFNKQVSTKVIDLDIQMSIYMMAAVKMGIKAEGVLYNVIRVAEGGIAATRPVERRHVFRRIDGLRLLEAEMSLQLDEMKEFHENGGRVYRNPTANCSWDCSFYGACLAMNDDGDPQTALQIYKTRPIIQEKDLGDIGE